MIMMEMERIHCRIVKFQCESQVTVDEEDEAGSGSTGDTYGNNDNAETTE